MRIKRRLAVAGMEQADVQQGAAQETAAPPTVERLRQLPIPAKTQPHTSPAHPLHPGSAAAAASDSGSPVSAESEQGQPEGSGSQRREQQRQVVAASKERHVPPSQRQCMQCGASTPGVRRHWARHPATKEEWLCHSCYDRACRQLKRKRQHEAAATASDSDGREESGLKYEEAQPPSQLPHATQQAAPVQPPMPVPPVRQRVPAAMAADRFAEARQQQQQQQPQGVNPDATWEPAPEQPALLPAHMPPTQASTGLLVLEAAPQAAAAAAGLTEGLARTFGALLPMPAEQDECLRLMLQQRQYSGAAGLMWATLHMRGILPPIIDPSSTSSLML
ncbi:hypothetical protein D9Q98_004960 [Chlorella vulgaris]|uniref:Uncharacterized protein n=1 Tax=Chlorella vulgaris TaxID=3077 RepID=A0A9D4TN67_CHLVU|nr:hypothetical protein D9Q98_004960 [Chlorella vulgaris]